MPPSTGTALGRRRLIEKTGAGRRSGKPGRSSADLASPPPRPLDRRWPLALFLLPLAILLLDHQWIFSDPIRDPWIYYGYFRNVPDYLATFRPFYFSSRLSVILPGALVHGLLSPIPANLVLHLGMYWAGLFSFYGVARAQFGPAAALLSALCLGAHPFFLFAVGQNYVDGFGITYFLMALFGVTFAPRVRFGRALLALAGASAAAMVTANLFYAIYLPFLAVWFLALDRRAPARKLLAGAGLFAAGGAVAVFALGLASKAAGGSFFYLVSSGLFVRGFVQQTNPFKLPVGQWLSAAVWLSIPTAILVGCCVVLCRPRARDAEDELRRIRFSQALFLVFALLMLAFQVSPYAAVLQYSYYASLLIPLAWLALAGQLALLLRAPKGASLNWLAGLTAASAVLTAGLSLNAPQSLPLGRLPVLLVLLVGLGAPLAVRNGAAGGRSAVFFLLFVVASQGLAKQFPAHRSIEQYHQDKAELFREIDESVTAVREIDRSGNVYFWWNAEEDLAQVYDCIAATALSGRRIVNLGFPETLGGHMADGGRLSAHMKLAVLSREPDVAKAEDALGRIGLHGRLLSTKRIAVGDGGFTMMFLELARAPRREN